MTQELYTKENNKLAWELVHSQYWKVLLQPYLDSRAQQKPKAIKSLDGAFEAAQVQAGSEFAANLIALIERMSEHHQSQSGG